MKKIRVLVVDDSVFMRKFITRLIEEDPALEVVGTAKNGVEAVQYVREFKPDVVTLDIEMPVMNGLEALKIIMEERPTPVIILSSFARQDAHETVAALQYGAVDFVRKPSGSVSVDLYVKKDEIIGKIKMAARAPAVALLPLRQRERNRAERERTTESSEIPKGVPKGLKAQKKETDIKQMVAIGTSTGGPKALETVLSELPADFPHPVLVVQHMPPKFTRSLAQRLDRVCAVHVVEAEDGEQICGGTVYIAPGDFHMTIHGKGNEFFIRLNREKPRNGHRPSVDVLFESVARLRGVVQHYVLMTGMGYDGAQGMASAKKAGKCTTIAEAEETCVVFGMPKAAIEKNCVDWVLPLDKIASKILEVTGYTKERTKECTKKLKNINTS